MSTRQIKIRKIVNSYWFCEVIKPVHASATAAKLNVHNLRVHKMCSIALSLLSMRHFAVIQLLIAGMWKSQFSITALFLRNVTHKSINACSIGPVLTALRVANTDPVGDCCVKSNKHEM